MNDTILFKDLSDHSKKIKKNKLLLQTAVRKLHSDLIADVVECVSHQMGKSLSYTKLRALFPLVLPVYIPTKGSHSGNYR